jgi:hypothetical protein
VGEETNSQSWFRLLRVNSRPGFVFKIEDIIQTVWGSAARRCGIAQNMVYRLRKMEDRSGDASDSNLFGGYGFWMIEIPVIDRPHT